MKLNKYNDLIMIYIYLRYVFRIKVYYMITNTLSGCILRINFLYDFLISAGLAEGSTWSIS
jgi:hypothetical protein